MEFPAIPQMIFAAAVLVVAYAVRGTTGFGGQAIAVPLLALVLPLPPVVAAIAVLTALSSFAHWRADRDKIAWRQIFQLLPFTLAGILAGLYILNMVDVRTLTRAFGIFVICYAVFTLATSARPLRVPARFARLLGAVLSVLAGLAGAIFGAAAGPLYAMYFNAVNLEKDSFRVTITTILAFQALARIAGYIPLGLYKNESAWFLMVVGLPLMLLGSYIGARMAGRLDQRTFNRAIAALLLLSGVALLLK